MKKVKFVVGPIVALSTMLAPVAIPAASAGVAMSSPMQVKEIDVNGALFARPYGFAAIDPATRHATEYLPLWYIQLAMKKLGIDSQWNGTTNSLDITTNNTLVVGSTNTQPGLNSFKIYVNGKYVTSGNKIVRTDPYSGQATTFVPIWYIMSTLRQLNVSVSWNGTVLSLGGAVSGVVSAQQSTITSSVSTMTAGQSVTIHVTPKDSNGNPLGSGQVVTVSDGTGKTVTALWNQTNQDYEATFAETTAKQYSFSALVNGTPLLRTAGVTVVPAGLSGSTSTVTAPKAAIAGSAIVVQVVPKDHYGNALGSGDTVTITDGTQTMAATWNAANQDYEAVFTESKDGSYTFTASMNGTTFAQAPTTVVGPGSLASLSTVVGPTSPVTAGSANVTIVVKPFDANGNPIGFGQSVVVWDGAGQAVTATWNAAKNDYEATFSETKPGSFTFDATVNGTLLSNTANVTVVAGQVSGAESTVSAPSSANAGQNITVQVVPKDVQGNPLGSGETVTVSDGSSTKVAIWNAQNQDYEATFTELKVGTYKFVAAVNGVTFSQQPSTVVNPGTLSSFSTVTASQSTVTAGNSNVVIAVVPKDSNGNPLGDGQGVVVSDGSHSEAAVWNSTRQDYEATFSETVAGTYTYSAAVNNTNLVNTAQVTVNPASVSAAESTVHAPTAATAGNSITVQVVPKDAYQNPVGSGQTVTVSDGTHNVTATWNSANNDYEATFTETKAGNYTFTAKMNGVTFTQQPQTAVTVGQLDTASTVSGPQGAVTAGTSNVTISVVPKDTNGNPLGANQVVTVSDGKGQTLTAKWNAATGSYQATFSEPIAQTYTFTAQVNSVTLSDTAQVTVVPAVVDGGTSTVTAAGSGVAGQPITVSVVPKDALDNLIGSGQTVTVTDGTHTVVATWNSANQDYQATFTETTAGKYTFTAKMDGVTFTMQPTQDVVPATVSSLSTVTGPQGNVVAGNNNVSITVVPRDASGNVITPAQVTNITVSDGNGQTQQATWNGSNGYVATFSETQAGAFTYTATVTDAGAVTSLTQTAKVTVIAAVVDVGKSSITATSDGIAGDPIAVVVTPRDANGNPIGAGQSVTVTDGNGNSWTATWNPTNANYEVNATELQSGTYTFTAHVDGVSFAATPVTLGPGTVASLSSVSGPTTAVTAGSGNVTIKVIPRDKNGNPLGASQNVQISDGTGSPTVSWKQAQFDSTNGDYYYTFNETTAGTYTYSVQVNGTLLNQTVTVSVVPGTASASKSTVTSPTTAVAGASFVVAVKPEDANGNKILSGQTVTVSDGQGHSWTAVWNATNQDYEAQVTEFTTGAYVFAASVQGVTFTSANQTVVSAGTVSSMSTITGPQGDVTAGNSNVTIAVVPKDSNGNPLGSGQTVEVSDGSLMQTAVWNSANQNYEVTFSETVAGSYTYSATVNNQLLTNTLGVTVVPAGASASRTTVMASATSVTAGTPITVTVTPIDGFGNPLGLGQTVLVTDGKYSEAASWNGSAYTATFTERSTGTYTFSAIVNGVAITQTASTNVTNSALDLNSTITGPVGNVTAGTQNVTISVVPKDTNGNPLGANQVVTVSDGKGQTLTALWNAMTGSYQAIFSESIAQTYTFTAEVNNVTLSDTAQVTVIAAAVNAGTSSITATSDGIAGDPIAVVVTPRDANGNPIGAGQSVTVTDGNGNSWTATWNPTNANYEVNATELQSGTYTFTAHVDGVSFAATPVTLGPGTVASLSSVSGPTTAVTAGSGNVTIKVIPRDKNGNPLGASQNVQISDGTGSPTVSWKQAQFDSTNGDYYYTFNETTAGTYTYSVQVNGTLLNQTVTVSVVPGTASASKSTVTSPTTAVAGASFVVAVKPEDANGNPILSGQTVTVSDGQGHSWTAVWNATNQDYEAQVTEFTTGAYVFAASVQGVTFTSANQTVVSAGTVSSMSTITGPQGDVTAGNSNVTIAVVPKDSNGNPLGSGQTVVVSDGSQTQTAVWNSVNQNYEATFSETVAGSYTYSAKVNNQLLTNTLGVTVVPAGASASRTTVMASATSVTAGTPITVTVTPIDGFGNPLGLGQTVLVTDGKYSEAASWNGSAYTATFTERSTGTYTFSAIVNGVAITQTASTNVTNSALDLYSTITGPVGNVTAGSNNVTISVVPKDTNGNPLGANQVVTVSDGKGQTLTAKWNAVTGSYQATFSEPIAQTYTFTAQVNNVTLSDTAQVTVVPAAVDGGTSTVTAAGSGVAGQPITVLVVPKDALGNPIGSGQTVTVTDGTHTVVATWNSANQDYQATFTETTAGKYTFTAKMDGVTFTMQPTQDVAPATVSSLSTVTGPQGNVVAGNNNVSITVVPRDASGNVITPAQVTNITVSDGNGQTQQATWNGSNGYVATFSETQAGTFTYTATVTDAGAVTSLTQTAKVTVIAAAVNAGTSSITAISDGIAGDPIAIVVTPKDANGNLIGAGQSVTVTDGNGNSWTATWNPTNANYEVNATELQSGTYTFTAHVDGVSFAATPVTLGPGTVASLSSVSGPTTAVTAGSGNVTIKVIPRDKNGNPLGASQNVQISDGTGSPTVSWKQAQFDSTNGDYYYTFNETTAGTYTYSVQVNGTLLNQTVTVSVVPGTASASKSTVTSPTTAVAGASFVVAVKPEDANGNPILSGQTVTVSDGQGHSWTAVWNATNQDYEAQVTEFTTGAYVFAASVQGVTFTSANQTVVSAGTVSSMSTITGPQGDVTAGNSNVTIAVVPKDSNGNPLGSGQTVEVSDGSLMQTAVWNSANQNYEVTFSETVAGSYTYSATVNNQLLTNTLGVTVVPAGASASRTTVMASATSVTAGTPITVTVTPIDGFGNPLGLGQTVLVTDGKYSEAASWNGSAYTATFTERSTGTYTFSAIVNGVAITQTASTNVTNSALDLNSTITGPVGNVTAGTQNVTISVVPKDTNGNPLGAGQTVYIYTGTPETATWNAANQDYEYTFDMRTAGLFTFKANVNGQLLNSTYTVNVVAGAVDSVESTVTAPTSALAGQAITVSVTPKDFYGNPIGSGQTVSVSDGAGHTVTAVWDSVTGTYRATFTETAVGNYTFTATINGVALTAEPTTVVDAGNVDQNSPVTVSPTTVTAGATFTVAVTPKDANGNLLGLAQNPTVEVTVNGTNKQATWNAANNDWEAQFAIDAAGTYATATTVNGVVLNSTPSVTVTAGVVSGSQSTITGPTSVSAGSPITIHVVPKDQYANPIGDNQTVTVSDGAGHTTAATWNSANQDYEATFTESTPGTYNFTAGMNGVALGTGVSVTVTSAIDATTSQLIVPTPTVYNGSVEVKVIPYDTNGALVGNGQYVVVSDGITQQTAQWNPVDQAYETIFTESVPNVETFTYSATVNGVALSQTGTATVHAVVDPTWSTVSAPSSVLAGQTVNVTVVPKDKYAVTITEPQTITVQDSRHNSVAATWDAAANAYVAQFTYTTSGPVTYTAVVTTHSGSLTLDQTPTTDIVPLTPFISGTSYTVLNGPTGGGTAGVAMTYTLKLMDQYGNPITGLTSADFTPSVVSGTAADVQFSSVTETSTPGTYTFAVTDTKAENLTVKVAVTDPAGTITYVTAGPETITGNANQLNLSQSTISAPASVSAGTAFTVSATLVDKYGNPIVGANNVTITDSYGTTETAVWNATNQNYEVSFTEPAGNVGFDIVDGQSLTTGAITQVQPANVSSPIQPTATPPAGDTSQFVGSVSGGTGQAMQVPNYGAGLSTLTGTGPTAADTGNTGTDIGFYYLSKFPTTSLKNFNVKPIMSMGYSNSLWITDPSGYDGGSNTPNGLTFFTATVNLPQAEQVTVSIPQVDDVGLAWVDGTPVAYNTDIGGYNSGWATVGVTMPPTKTTISLGAGLHQIVLEVANAFHPGGNNSAGVGFSMTGPSGNVIINSSSTYLNQWMSTGYTTQLPVFWYSTAGNYTIDEEMLNPNSLVVTNTSKWSINAGPIRATNTTVITNIGFNPNSVTVAAGTTAAQLTSDVTSTNSSVPLTFSVQDSTGAPVSGSTVLVAGDVLVTQDATGNQTTYPITIG
ncbi:invasin domain 3-containing protein [Alicyclobacillus sp. ALC3]|uniref:invasin domain 3-containing protein n=1 Tax=Alicyclobacillus sp. ALC3 TaxID=2796143 RepID=UPI0023782629|nr:invasin domain 3-containing protein [Alicyclobacillus sp. ALC3]WDL97276.1 hypothetical protein JC200_00485 [Alicyclobacillus sp. ALC3]